jgi:hypothetical protein
MRDAQIRELVSMPEAELKLLWDQYDGTNSPGGRDGEDIHIALNIKGFGDYCAV